MSISLRSEWAWVAESRRRGVGLDGRKLWTLFRATIWVVRQTFVSSMLGVAQRCCILSRLYFGWCNQADRLVRGEPRRRGPCLRSASGAASQQGSMLVFLSKIIQSQCAVPKASEPATTGPARVLSTGLRALSIALVLRGVLGTVLLRVQSGASPHVVMGAGKRTDTQAQVPAIELADLSAIAG